MCMSRTIGKVIIILLLLLSLFIFKHHSMTRYVVGKYRSSLVEQTLEPTHTHFEYWILSWRLLEFDFMYLPINRITAQESFYCYLMCVPEVIATHPHSLPSGSPNTVHNNTIKVRSILCILSILSPGPASGHNLKCHLKSHPVQSMEEWMDGNCHWIGHHRVGR